MTTQEKALWERVRTACRAEDFEQAGIIADGAGPLKNDLLHFIRFTSENFCLPREYWEKGVK